MSCIVSQVIWMVNDTRSGFIDWQSCKKKEILKIILYQFLPGIGAVCCIVYLLYMEYEC